MSPFIVKVRGKIIGSGFGTKRQANSFAVNFVKQHPGTRPSISSVPAPTPIPPGGGFQIFTVDRGGGRTPQTTSVFRTFGTRREAEIFLEANRLSIADRETSVGIRSTPTAAEAAAFQRFQGRQVTGPPKSERGLKIQRQRLELEKIQKDVTVTEGKVDTSQLTSGQRARVRQITGVAAEKAFTVQAAKPTTREEFQKSLIASQRGVALTEKIRKKQQTITVSPARLKEIKAESLVERARETKQQQLRKIGGELIFKPSIEFFERVPGAPAKKPKLPTESELIQELKAQKGFVTFVAPTIKDEPERIKQISVFKPILVPVKSKPLKPIKKPTTRLEKFEQRIALLQEREQARAERFKQGQEFFRIVPILRGDEIIIKGISVKKIIRIAPTIPAAAADFFVSVGEKGAAFAEAATIKETRPLIFPELRRAAIGTPAETGRFFKELFTTEEGLATLPFLALPFLKPLTKEGQAASVLKQVAKEPPPLIVREQFFGLKRIVKDITTEKIVTTPEVKVTQPTKFVTTKLDITTVKPTVEVAKSVGGPTTFRTVTVGGKQFTTATKITRTGKEFFIRSETEIATGKTVTKVFRGDTLLRTIKSKQKPSIAFTEPIEKISSKRLLSTPEALTETVKRIRTSKGVSLLEKGKFDIRGTRAILSQEVLRAQVISPRVRTFAKIEVDIRTGKVKLVPKSVEVIQERIKFVDFPAKQKKIKITRTPEGVEIIRPSTILVEQAVRLRVPSEISFFKRAKPKKIPKEKPKIKKFFTPEEFTQELIRRKELAPIVEKKLRREGLFGRLFFEERPQIIELDPRLPLTKREVRGERIELLKEITVKAPSLFVKKPLQVIKAVREITTREKTLTHELLHFKFPNKSEKQILRLERKTTKFKADNKQKEVIAKLRTERRKELLESIQEQVKKGKEALKKLKKKKKVEVVEVARPKQPVTKLPKEFKFFVPEAEIITRGFVPIAVPLAISIAAQAQIPITQQRIIQEPRLTQEQRAIQEQKAIQQQRLIQQQRIAQKSKAIQESKIIQELRSIQEPIIIQKQRVIQESRLIQEPKLIQEPRVITRPIVEVPGVRIVTITVPKGPFVPLIPLPGKVRAGIKKPAFQTQVREGERKADKFFDTGKPLPKNRALNRGARIVDNTTARSFKIKRSGTTRLRDDKEFFLREKFRGVKGKTKLPRNTFIEKSKFAIDSPGERLGIPFAPSRIPRLRQALAIKKARRTQRFRAPIRKLPKPLIMGRGRVMRFL